MKSLLQRKEISLYQLEDQEQVERFITSTPETRNITNDPFILGVHYTTLLENAMTKTIEALNLDKKEEITQENTVVLHILRGGLNFGLREALHRAYGWNHHSSAYISSQRAKDEKGDWYITENRYQKVYIPEKAHIIFGDVVATGASLEHAMLEIVRIAKEQKKEIGSWTFFTIGGDRAEKIMERLDAKCREEFPSYKGSRVVYVEGVFGVATEDSELQVALGGTDLLRDNAVLAPEFAESQSESPSFPIERCTIYDAGSRAFHVAEYLDDVREYWEQVKAIAENGTTYSEYLKERYPDDPRLQDTAWVAGNNTPERLLTIAEEQIAKTILL